MLTARPSRDPVRLQRCAVLAAVLALHAALLAALLLASSRPVPVSTAQAIELLLLAPADKPLSIAESGHPQHVHGVAALIVTPPPLMEFSSTPPPGSATDESISKTAGQESGVDWNAEAHRAIQAFAIRSHQPKNGASVAGLPGEDHWLPRTPHHAGDEVKTPGGDWIVWISSNCYQVATSAPNSDALAAAPPPTICRDNPAAPDPKPHL
jgi:hypothetical protein